MLSIDPSLPYLIVDPTDPAVVWDMLSNQFQKKTWANKLALRRRLHSLKLKEGQSVQEHIKQITEIFDELSVIGDKIENEDRVVYLLASLPESYEMLVTPLEANTEVPDMATVTERLLYEERKLKDRVGQGSSSTAGAMEEAMAVKHKRKGPRCYYCHRIGHVQRNCREREKKMTFEGGHNSKQRPAKQNDPHKVNSVEVSVDEVGLVVQHARSAKMEKASGMNWIIDSGATCHICNDRSFFVDMKSLEKPLDIALEDSCVLKAQGTGTVILMIQSGSLERKCKLHNVLYVPELAYNLMSVAKAIERGADLVFNDRGCMIKDANHKLIAMATKVGNLYYLPHAKPKDHVHVTDSVQSTSNRPLKEDLWHRRYGHLGGRNLEKLSKVNLVEGFDYCISKEISFCEPCLKGKLQRNQFSAHSERKTSKPLELIHSDVCGKISSKSLSGAEYFVTFTDDKTRYIWVYPIKRKSEVFQKFKEWKTDVEKSLGQSVKIFRSDNGGEFTSTEFEEYLKKEGIKHELTISKCP